MPGTLYTVWELADLNYGLTAFIKYQSTYSEWLDRILVSDLPGKQDRVLHGGLHSEVGGKH